MPTLEKGLKSGKSIQITDLSSQARWVSGRLTDANNTKNNQELPWMGSLDDERGFVRLEDVKLENGQAEKALRTHPKWVENGTIKGWHPWVQLPSNAIFEADVGFAQGANNTDGVTFQVWEHHKEGGRTVWNKVADVYKDYTGNLKHIQADLSHLSGEKVGIELRVDAGESASQDWAVWTNVYIEENEETTASPITSKVGRQLGGNRQKVINDLPDERKDNYVCNVKEVKLTAVSAEGMLLNPQTDIIWPGSLLDASSIASGEYTPITNVKRVPLTISISHPNLTGSSSVTVSDPSLSTVRDGIRQLYERVRGATPARISYEKHNFHSEEQLDVALNAHFNHGKHNLSAEFKFSKDVAKSRLVVKYWQIYYTIDVDPGTIQIKGEANNDYAYISSVKYGRLLLFSFESEATETDLEAAVDYAMGEKVSADLEAKYNKILEKTETNVLIRGGSAEDGAYYGLNKEKIQEWIETGSRFSMDSPGLPLAYTLRYVSDNAIANVLMSTTYKVRNCQKATGTFEVTVLKLKCKSVHDPGPQAEIYGEIEVSAYEKEGNNPIEKKTKWHRGSQDFVSLSEGDEVPINSTERFTFNNLHEIKDTAYIKVAAHLKEHDRPFYNKDDDYGWESKEVPLREAAEDPNRGPNEVPGSDRTIYFSPGRARYEIYFEVKPV